MSGQIGVYDSAEPWYTVTAMELAEEYLIRDDLIDLKFADGLIVPSENSMPNTAPELNNPTHQPVDMQQRGPPDRNIIDTPYCFTVEINSSDTNKKRYLYSHRLNRIYVDMECDFSVQFNWQAAPGGCMWVRSCVVFADDAQAQKRPQCCLQHLHQGAHTDVNKHIGLNVLQSSRPIGTLGVEYHGSASAPDSWLSAVVALSKPGAESVAHAYKFVCKSSCSSGINRRAIAIIFTLEDLQGKVFGRQMVGARVCACPRRDMLKDEQAEGVFKSGKKRVPGNMTQPKQKKIKREACEERGPTLPPNADMREYVMPSLVVMDESIALAGLEMMLAMSELARKLQRSDADAARADAHVTKLKETIQELKEKSSTN